jgi:amino acid adenylation domain-containing protein
LREAGVESESLVGLCVERSAQMIVGLLAILKAGGAYIPLDPAYPSERLAYMINDSGSRFIIAEKATQEFISSSSAKHILLDEFDEERYSSEAPQIEISPEDLAYIIYTSGSTGNPKGAMIEHRNLASFANWMRSRFTKQQTAYVLAGASLSFDGSVMEYTAALASGGTLVVVRNVLDLLLAPPSEPLSFIFSTPSPIVELVRSRAVPASVHTIVLGGELLTHVLANDIYATTGVQELVNIWGLTEDTVCATDYIVPRINVSDPPIGQAFAGRGVHLLDPGDLKPVPDGVPGELCCTGEGVGRGYLNRPELTEQRYVPNPYGDSKFMYRSGDLAVREANGDIKFIGRNDQQIKLRGFRIELGEIEAALSDHPNIAQVAVIAKGNGGDTHLAMFAILRPHTTLALNDVEQFLSSRMPKHMIPSTLTLLDAMPLAPTGKTDRKALQQLMRRRPNLPERYIAPRDAVEQHISELFCSLLGLESVGMRDNFFAIGGQSLLAARVVAEVSQQYPEHVKALEQREGERALILAFWQAPTIEQLSAALQNTASRTSVAIGDIRCLQEGDIDTTPLFLLHGVIDNEAFYTWNLALAFGPDQPVYTLAPHGLNGKPIPLTVEEMAADYLAQIRNIQPRGPYRFAGYCNGGIVCYEMARMLETQGEHVNRLILIGAPGHNVHFRPLERLVGGIAAIGGMKPSARREFFLRTRSMIIRAAKSLRPAKPDGLPPRPPRVLLDAPTKAREDEITRVVDAYVPKPYGGPMSLVFGEDDEYLKVYQPFEDWSRLVKRMKGSLVKGDHHFIEDHPELALPVFDL